MVYDDTDRVFAHMDEVDVSCPAESSKARQVDVKPRLAAQTQLPDELRCILESVSDLPTAVLSAPCVRIEQRKICQPFLDTILSQPPPAANHANWQQRLKDRKNALTPHLGKVLCGVFVCLPGYHCTIEIDRSTAKVVYWEWQRV
jgi:hypothetical protein